MPMAKPEYSNWRRPGAPGLLETTAWYVPACSASARSPSITATTVICSWLRHGAFKTSTARRVQPRQLLPSDRLDDAARGGLTDHEPARAPRRGRPRHWAPPSLPEPPTVQDVHLV